MRRVLKYVRAAFFVREEVPLLGALPVNVMAVLGFAALGFGHPAFWLLGLLGETIFLWLVAGSPRFRKLADALDLKLESAAAGARQEQLASQLSGEARERYSSLVGRFDQVKDYYRQYAADDYVADENLANLGSLESVFLRLLVARQHLTSPHREAEVEKVRARILALQAEIDAPARLTAPAIESRKATIELLQKRLGVFERRGQAIDEIESDLDQIEVQFQLAADSATIRAKPADTKLDMDLARIMLSSPDYLALGGERSPELIGGGAMLELE